MRPEIEKTLLSEKETRLIELDSPNLDDYINRVKKTQAIKAYDAGYRAGKKDLLEWLERKGRFEYRGNRDGLTFEGRIIEIDNDDWRELCKETHGV